MSDISIDALGVTSADLNKTVEFYSVLGFQFPEFAPDDAHLEAITEPGKTRLMVDARSLATKLIGEEPKPSNHSHFALLCTSPEHVNEIVHKLGRAGHSIVAAPWDAFWGQRYAIVADPDGYRIDLFAGL